MPRIKNWLTACLIAIWIVSACFFFRLQWRDTARGYPYESWDEIATYNSAVSIWTEASGRVYSYGGLNTLQQLAANWIHERFDPIGRKFPAVRYSNNAVASFSDPDLGTKAKTWVGMDHHYFRGLTDHEPIFLSRKVHLLVFALLFVGLGVYLISRNAKVGVITSLAFLSFLPSAEVLDGVEKALPGLQNSILALICLLLAGEAVRRQSVRCLLGAITVLAISLNIKIDTLALLAPLGCVSIYLALKLKRAWSERILLLGGIGAFVVLSFFAFRVSMWLRGHPELAPQYFTLKGFSGGLVDVRSNLNVFETMARSNGLFPFESTWSFPLGTVIFMVMASALLISFTFFGTSEFLIFGGTSLLLWSLIIFRATSVGLQTRYFLYSYVICQFGFAWLIGRLIVSSRRGLRAFASIATVTICVITFRSGLRLSNDVKSMETSQAALDGMDPHHNYNVATERAIALFRAGGYDRRILVDQHSYLDLRRFRALGMEPVLVNIFNFEEVLGKLRQGSQQTSLPLIILFSPGAIHKWNDSYSGPDWSDENKAKYTAYEQRLKEFPLMDSIGSGRRELLDPGPVEASSPMQIRRWVSAL